MNDDATSQKTLDAPMGDEVESSPEPFTGVDGRPDGEGAATAGGVVPPAFKPSVIRTRVIPLFALAMVLGLLGVLAYSLFGPKDARVTGRINSSGAIVTENGRSAPNFSAPLFGGGTFNLADQRGKIVVINFWASWCPPCRQEAPLLTTAASSLAPDVTLVGVDVWDKQSDAQDFLDEFRVNYPVARDERSIALDYGLTGVPETFVVDASGKIAARLPGPITSMQQLNDMIAAAR